jgi:hypothetical protein
MESFWLWEYTVVINIERVQKRAHLFIIVFKLFYGKIVQQFLYVNFYPESLTLFVALGRSPDLRLATYLPIAVPYRNIYSGFEVVTSIPYQGIKLTVAGTVPELNRIPF